MSEELTITDNFVFTKGGEQINCEAGRIIGRPLKIFVNGSGGIKSKILVTTDPRVLDFSEVNPVGYTYLKNLGEPLIKTPATPVVSVEGATGSATWGYKILANQSADVNTIASLAGTVATGVATLTDINYNFIQWLPVGGAVSYDVYRTTSGGTPALLGWFTNVLASNTFIDEDGVTYVFATDTGFVGDGDPPPTFSPFDFSLLIGFLAGCDDPPGAVVYPIRIRGGQSARFPLVDQNVYVKTEFNPTWLEQTILPE